MDSSRGSRVPPVLAGGLVLLTLAFGAAVACGNYVPPDVAKDGPPNGLSGKSPPAPSASGSPGAGGDGGSDDAGTSPGSGSSSGGSSGGGTGAYACVTAGGTLIDAGSCSVSWTNDIYPQMESGGAWLCGTSACHGSVTPVLNGTAESYYTTLANYTATTTTGAGAGEPYINPCSTEAAASDFVCNTQTTGFCGAEAMPLGLTIAAAGLANIATWVKCGSPLN